MHSFKFVDKNIGYVAAAFALLVSLVLPALAFAAQVTERSIALTSSSVSATGVSYDVTFTSVGAADAFVVDFCSNSPLIGTECTAPAGFSVSSATTATAGFTRTVIDANTIQLTGTVAADTEVNVAIDNVTNPSTAGALYARIITYDTTVDYTDAENIGSNNVDDGGVAMSITPTIGVSGAVLESMTFCVASAVITADCANAAANAPTLKLGETVGTEVALVPGTLSTGDLYAQVSTNAASGVIVRLKSNATDCGGLLRAGAAPGTCDILPALADGITVPTSEFGVLATAAADTGSSPSGVFQAANSYNDTTYVLNYAAGNATGVTSPYGDLFLDTNGAPANNKNMQLTFGATVDNDTPAGLYSADLSLIATGTF